MNNKLVFLLLTLFLKDVLSSAGDCNLHDTCHECIQDPNKCGWCASIKHNGNRCQALTSDTNWCSEPLQKPINKVTIEINSNFSSDTKITQLRPQKFSLKLSPGQEAPFKFHYKGVSGYPVDLYFLFDASKSMAERRAEIADQSQQIYDSIHNLTKNVNLGMGTFIDKNAYPFTTLIHQNLAYSFKHHLSMNEDYKTFQDEISKIKDGQNRDIPEGGMDALAQAIVCTNVIKWRKDSRKIIIYLTNELFHLAGDGRSAGIFKPYDGLCHTVNNSYINELTMDYPSVSMINKLARENQVIVIFLIADTYKSQYKHLADCIRESRAVVFDGANNNITNILKNIYEDITRTIDINWNVRNGRKKNYEISFDPQCTEEKTELDDQLKKKCAMRDGDEYEFNGTIKLLKYDPDYATNVIDVSIKGINEKIELHIEAINDCDCERDSKTDFEHCNGETLICGQCKCVKESGNKCGCDSESSNQRESNCIDPTKEQNITCSGRGTCLCGSCKECKTGFTGVYCQCKNCELGLYKAPCSGIANGICHCNGTCGCNHGRAGRVCQCDEIASKPCLVNNNVCNKRGHCNCEASGSHCDCEDLAFWDKREEQDKTCVVLPCVKNPNICHSRQCNYLDECAVCILEKQDECDCYKSSKLKYEIVEEFLDEQVIKDEWSICPKVRVDVGCYSTYAYKYDTEEYRILLTLQKKRDCNKIYYTTAAAILGTILLVGILTMVAWKLINDYRDRKEFDRFVKDHKNDGAAKCENPLYEQPTTMINNPAFRKRSINRY